MKRQPDPRIAEILLSDWDPIGIKDNSDAAAEYSTYALQVFGLLHNGAGEKEIIEYLTRVVRDNLELIPNHEKIAVVAKRLTSLKL